MIEAILEDRVVPSTVSVLGLSAWDKAYDGGTTAVLDFSGATLDGVDPSHDVYLDTNYHSADFVAKDVGYGVSITVSGLTLSGNDAWYYTLEQPDYLSADITPLTLTISASSEHKTYDGTTTATANLSDDRLYGDDLYAHYGSADFADKNVGYSKSVTISGLWLDGPDAGNYTLADSYAYTTADITPLTLTVSATADHKTYDGTTTATANLSDDRLTGDDLYAHYGSADFADKNAGTDKTVTLSGLWLSGPDAGNYSLAEGTLYTTADITARTLTVSASSENKVYDGTTAATVTFSDDRLYGDDLTIDFSSADFADKNVGTSKTVTVSGLSLSGPDAGNYSLLDTYAYTTADITTRTLTVTASAENKEYDGTTAATVTFSDDRVEGDDVAIYHNSADFSDKHAGTGKTVTIADMSLGGMDAGNYTLNDTTAYAAADITLRTLTVTASADNKVYDGTTDATVTLSDDRINGDDLTVSYVSAAFDDANADTNKTVTVSDLSLSGSDAGNYTLADTSAPANADITPAPLEVTADDQYKDYGTADPALTFTYTGLVGSDTSASFEGTLTREPGEDPGTYPISQGSLVATGNYFIDSFQTGTLTIGEPEPDPDPPENQSPVAEDDSFTTNEDTPLSDSVTSNDYDVDEDTLTYSVVSDVSHGTLDFNSDGSFTYTPDEDWHGEDSFTYQVDDGNGGTDTATATITVNPVNDAPRVTSPGDQYHTERDQVSLTIEATDPEGDDMSFSATGLPEGLAIDPQTGEIYGTLSCESAGTYSITVTVTDNPSSGSPLATNIYFTWEVAEVGHALVIWVGLGDGTSWYDPANWNINDIPQHCDDVYIDAPSTTVLHESGDVSIHSLTLFAGSTLSFTGNLTLATDSLLDGFFEFDGTLNQLDGMLAMAGGGTINGMIDVGGGVELQIRNEVVDVMDGVVFSGLGVVSALGNGTINVLGAATVARLNLHQAGAVDGPGNLFVVGSATWNGGEFKGTGQITVAATGTLTITESTVKKLTGRNLNNAGKIVWNGGNIEVMNAKINNEGRFEQTGGLSVLNSGGVVEFNNSGEFDFNALQSGDRIIHIPFVNTGTMDIGIGTLQIAQLKSSGTINILGTLQVAQLEFSTGAIRGIGTLKISQNMEWTGGTMSTAAPNDNDIPTFFGHTIIDVNAIVNVSEETTKRIENRTFTNKGQINWYDGNWRMADFSEITNEGTIEWSGGDWVITESTFTNSGTLELKGNVIFRRLANSVALLENTNYIVMSAGVDAQINLEWKNLGTIEVQTGTLNLRREGVHTGIFLANPDAKILFSQTAPASVSVQGSAVFLGLGTYVIGQNAILEIAGPDQLFGAPNIPFLQLNLGGSLFVAEGAGVNVDHFDWTGGRIDGAGTVMISSGIISGNDVKELNSAFLVIEGTMVWTDTGNIKVSGSGAINVFGASGVLDIQTDANIENDVNSPAGGIVIQGGIFKKSVSPGNVETTIELVTYVIDGGNVSLLGHRIEFSNTFVVDNGTLALGNGTLIVTTGISINSNGIVTGSGTIQGTVYNDGQIIVGGNSTIGVITIEGDYYHLDAGQLQVDISGTQQNQYDRLVVTGAVYTSGFLTVTLVNFNPAQGDSFKILEDGAGLTGAFGLNLPPLGGGLGWDEEYNANDFTLKVV